MKNAIRIQWRRKRRWMAGAAATAAATLATLVVVAAAPRLMAAGAATRSSILADVPLPALDALVARLAAQARANPSTFTNPGR